MEINNPENDTVFSEMVRVKLLFPIQLDCINKRNIPGRPAVIHYNLYAIDLCAVA